MSYCDLYLDKNLSCDMHDSLYLTEYAYPICKLMHSYDPEKYNDPGNLVDIRTLAICITGFLQQTFSKLQEGNKTCRFIVEKMVRLEPSYYTEQCKFCDNKWIWPHFSEVIQTLSKTKSFKNRYIRSLILGLVNGSARTYTKYRSIKFFDDVKEKEIPDFKNTFGELSKKAKLKLNVTEKFDEFVEEIKEIYEENEISSLFCRRVFGPFFPDFLSKHCGSILLYAFGALILCPLTVIFITFVCNFCRKKVFPSVCNFCWEKVFPVSFKDWLRSNFLNRRYVCGLVVLGAGRSTDLQTRLVVCRVDEDVDLPPGTRLRAFNYRLNIRA